MKHSHQHARLTWLRNIYTSERTSVLCTHSRSRAISMRGSRGCATYTQAKEPLCCGCTHEAEPSARAAHVVAQHIHKRKNLCAVDTLGGIQPTCNLSALTPICTLELNFFLLRCISLCIVLSPFSVTLLPYPSNMSPLGFSSSLILFARGRRFFPSAHMLKIKPGTKAAPTLQIITTKLFFLCQPCTTK